VWASFAVISASTYGASSEVSFAVTSRGRAIAVLGPSPEQRDPLVRLILERHATQPA